MILEVVFWASLGALVWTHVGYPLAAAAAARVRRRRGRGASDVTPSVTRDRRRVERGGGDRAAAREPARARLSRRPARDRRRLRRLRRPDGRARRGGRRARAARPAAPLPARREGRRAEPRRARDATARSSPSRTRTRPGRRTRSRKLVRSFADPDVAYVCGRLVLTDAAGSNREGVYWRYETWLRAQESALGSVTGGNGSIYAVRRSDYVEVDPRFGHDLSLPYVMVQHGRRAVYDPEALAFEKPTPEIETEYRRKVRMFEHCWLIVLRGRMLRRLPPGYLVEILSHRHLRYGERPPAPASCSGRTSRSSPRARAGSTTSRSASSSRSSLLARAPARAAALLRAHHVGDRRLALELPASRRARDLGPADGTR